LDISAGISAHANGLGMLAAIGSREEILSLEAWFLSQRRTWAQDRRRREKAGT
jgi:hypothetical protein